MNELEASTPIGDQKESCGKLKKINYKKQQWRVRFTPIKTMSKNQIQKTKRKESIFEESPITLTSKSLKSLILWMKANLILYH